jgi:hypothetical protein
MGANQTADPRERVVFANQFHSFRITPLADQTHITGDIDPRRTGHLAWGWSEDIAIPGWAIVSFNVTLIYFPVLGQTLGGNLTEPNPLLVFPFHKTVSQ